MSKCQRILAYKNLTYSNLGKYYCPNCGFKRPELTYKVTKLISQSPQASKFEVNGQPLTLHIGGTYNIYNALAAFAVGAHLGVSPDLIQAALDDPDERFLDAKKLLSLLIRN